MGFDLSWYKLTDGVVKFDESDVPDAFSWRYVGRQEWLSTMWDISHDSRRSCSCTGAKHDYFCSDPEVTRPTDFAAFREALKAAGLWRKPFRCMTRFLERHPDLYVGFSN